MGQFTKDVNIKLAGVQAPLTVYITGEVVDAAAFDAYTKTEEFKKAEKARMAKLAKDEKTFKSLKSSKLLTGFILFNPSGRRDFFCDEANVNQGK